MRSSVARPRRLRGSDEQRRGDDGNLHYDPPEASPGAAGATCADEAAPMVGKRRDLADAGEPERVQAPHGVVDADAPLEHAGLRGEGQRSQTRRVEGARTPERAAVRDEMRAGNGRRTDETMRFVVVSIATRRPIGSLDGSKMYFSQNRSGRPAGKDRGTRETAQSSRGDALARSLARLSRATAASKGTHPAGGESRSRPSRPTRGRGPPCSPPPGTCPP